MELYRRLQQLGAEGKPIRVGLVGCGQMGSGFTHVTSRMMGMNTVAISILTSSAAGRVAALGLDKDDIIITNQRNAAEDALRRGKRIVTEDAVLLPQLEGLDALVEATV
jgi:predicted homoserine dehydrogenase-like protein